MGRRRRSSPSILIIVQPSRFLGWAGVGWRPGGRARVRMRGCRRLPTLDPALLLRLLGLGRQPLPGQGLQVGQQGGGRAAGADHDGARKVSGVDENAGLMKKIDRGPGLARSTLSLAPSPRRTLFLSSLVSPTPTNSTLHSTHPLRASGAATPALSQERRPAAVLTRAPLPCRSERAAAKNKKSGRADVSHSTHRAHAFRDRDGPGRPGGDPAGGDDGPSGGSGEKGRGGRRRYGGRGGRPMQLHPCAQG